VDAGGRATRFNALQEPPMSLSSPLSPVPAADERTPPRRLELDGLLVFDAVMRERSVTRAALRLSLTQPAVSHALARLRLVFDDALFLKTRSGVRPTRRAEELWSEVQLPLEALRRAVDPTQFDPATAELTVSVAVNDMLVQERITPWYAQLRRSAPNVRLCLVTRTVGDTESRLVQGTLDFGLGLFSALPAGLHRKEIASERYVCVLRNGHPIARQPWTLDTFQAASHVRVSPNGELFRLADVGMRLAGMQTKVAMTVSHYTCVPGLVESTDLLALLPRFYAESAASRHRLEIRDLPFPAEPVKYELVWHDRSERSAALTWFREQLAGALRPQ
jgi:DNA-binding transcriptional LysR family regulator